MGTAKSRITSVQRDVTRLHWLECEVGEQKALIESVVDSAPLVIALLDSRCDKVILDNHEYKKLMGDLRMAEPATLILNAIRTGMGDRLRPSRAGEQAFGEHEIRLESSGGPRWFSCAGIWSSTIVVMPTPSFIDVMSAICC